MVVSAENIGRVVACSRRGATILTAAGARVQGRMAGELEGLCVGTFVRFEDNSQGPAMIVEVIKPQNCLAREYRGRQKKLAANLDHLFVVTALGPLFNTIFIDRILACADLEGIPVTLLVNKVDTVLDPNELSLNPYREIGVPILELSAKFDRGLEPLMAIWQRPDWAVIGLAGVSGVGKSTLLNRMVPGAGERVGEISIRTGQGKQTTSQARGYCLERAGAPPLVVIDFPGVQMFGVSHLSMEALRRSFPEFVRFGSCDFDNCSHIREPECAVKRAVTQGQIALSRYQNYVGMYDEIEAERLRYRRDSDT